MKTFKETFEELPHENKPEIAQAVLEFLCGAMTMMDKPTKDRIESILFAAMRSAKQTHESGK